MIDVVAIKKNKWKILAAVILFSAAAGLLVIWWRGPQVVVERVVRKDFIQTVVASGHVETPHRVDVGSQMTGTVLRVPVMEGQTVRAGDILVELESAELRAVERAAISAVVQAQTHVRQLRDVQGPIAEQALRQAQVTLDNSKSVLRRNQELFQKGFIGEAALDDFRKAVDLADAQKRTMQKQLETTRPSGSDYLLAEANVVGASASFDAARARSRYTVIAAPADGVLISRDVEVGDVVQAGKLLMTLSPAGRAQLVLEIDEKNLRLLDIHQKAVASADAYPQQRFPAELVYINPAVNIQTGAVEVKLDVLAPPALLRQDMTVSVDIEVARKPNVLLVPISSLHDADTGTPWVLRLENAHAIRRPVRLGLRSGGLAEVTDGILDGDLVIPATASVKAGARVRILPAAN